MLHCVLHSGGSAGPPPTRRSLRRASPAACGCCSTSSPVTYFCLSIESKTSVIVFVYSFGLVGFVCLFLWQWSVPRCPCRLTGCWGAFAARWRSCSSASTAGGVAVGGFSVVGFSFSVVAADLVLLVLHLALLVLVFLVLLILVF